MKPNAIAWLVIGYCCLVSLTLCGLAHSSDLTLTEKIASVVPSIANKKDEPVDAREFAEAITAVTDSPQWAALLITTARHEGGLSARIARSEYKPNEGDHGRAWGLFQNWKHAGNADVWGSPVIAVQVKAASHLSRQYYNMCRGSGVPFPLSTMRALSGRGCLMKLKGEDERMLTYQRVLARIR